MIAFARFAVFSDDFCEPDEKENKNMPDKKIITNNAEIKVFLNQIRDSAWELINLQDKIDEETQKFAWYIIKKTPRKHE